ncbi:20S proteasome subunit beta 3 [Paragonimus westermani]|uniref:20S proteasome subunit beta 3 n=1 Tax=Paragonimus westermani TaxID=34504 RepID=A0A5J4NIV9_9TREM|nr:20S proteasome subunit beta 3 [Paragonimus westermani]
MSILSYNGSAIIGMIGENCAAIASDLRFGVNFQTISTDFSKVHQLGPRIFVGFAGLVTDNQTVFQRLQFRKNVYELRENKSIRPQTITTMLANLLYERRSRKTRPAFRVHLTVHFERRRQRLSVWLGRACLSYVSLSSLYLLHVSLILCQL